METIKLEIQTKMEDLVTNTYIVYDVLTRDAMVIDPADDAMRIKTELTKNDLKLKYILYTHCHTDHVGAITELKKMFKDAEVVGSLTESKNIINPQVNQQAGFGIKLENIVTDITLSHHDKITLGNIEFTVIFTPGHTSRKYVNIFKRRRSCIYR